MLKKQRFEFETEFSGDSIFQTLLNDEQETGNKLTEKQYDLIYPLVRNILSILMIHLKIDTDKNDAEISSIVDGMGSIYRRVEKLSIDELANKNNLVGAIVLSLASFSNVELDAVYRFCEQIVLKKLKVI